jgi:hypothetical protein
VTGSDGPGEKALSMAKKDADQLRRKGSSLLARLELYRLLGIGSVVYAVAAFFRRPRWASIVAIPFAGCAGLVSIMII